MSKQRETRQGWTRLLAAAALGSVMLLSGCASYVTSGVTAFQNWQGGPGQQSGGQRTYVFDRAPEQQNDLEEQNYESLVAQSLMPYGFVQVEKSQAHYAVRLDYRQIATTAYAPQAIYPADPFMFGPVFRGRRGWGPGPYWGAPPVFVNMPYAAASSELMIRMKDLGDGKEVYKVTAKHVGDPVPLAVVMPYLVRSALADFPLPNGTVRDVKLPVVKPAKH